MVNSSISSAMRLPFHRSTSSPSQPSMPKPSARPKRGRPSHRRPAASSRRLPNRACSPRRAAPQIQMLQPPKRQVKPRRMPYRRSPIHHPSQPVRHPTSNRIQPSTRPPHPCRIARTRHPPVRRRDLPSSALARSAYWGLRSTPYVAKNKTSPPVCVGFAPWIQ